MIMGHFATALVADQKTSEKGESAPLWLFLLASQFLDFVMLAFFWLGLEKVTPGNFLEATFSNMKVDFLFSHGVVPALFWAAVFGLFAFVITRNKWVVLWCAALVVVHEVFDLLVGFQHHVIGTGTAEVGLNLYNHAPAAGLVIEALLCAAIVFWYLRKREASRRPVTARMRWGLYAVLVGGTVSNLIMTLFPTGA